MLNRPLYNEKYYHDDWLEIKAGAVVRRFYIRYAISNQSDIKMRIKESDKAFAHGSYAYGDGKFESRRLKLSMHVRGRSREEHDCKLNDLLQLFSLRDYELSFSRPDRAYRVAGMTEVKQKFVKGFKWLWSDVDVTLLLTDPFVYCPAPTVKSFVFSESQDGAEISFYTDGSVDTPLSFFFEPGEGSAMSDIRIDHLESGQSFTLQDALLSYPATARIDAYKGTVRRDDDNSINSFSGTFLHAGAGRNTLIYTGSPGRVDIIYTRRWLI